MSTNNNTSLLNSTIASAEYKSVLEALNYTTFVIGLFAIITNGLLILITVRDPLKCFQKSNNYFIISLAVSDFLTGITTCLYAFHRQIWTHGIFLIAIRTSIWVSVQNSVFTIFLMAVERFIVIRYPLNARRLITRGRTKVLIGITWVLSIVIGSTTGLPKPYDNYAMLGFMIECMIMVLSMLVLYACIVMLLRSNIGKFKRTKLCRRHRGGTGDSQRQKQQGASTVEQRNLNVVVFSLAVILCVTVIPYWAYGFYYIGFEMSCPKCPRPEYMNVVAFVVFCVELLNFTLNPVIYAWRLPAYRRSFLYYLNGRKPPRRMSRPSFSSADIGYKTCSYPMIPRWERNGSAGPISP